VAATRPRPISIKLVPYFAWGNRGDTEMTVWLPVRAPSASGDHE
jgi:DUF1680 family protein